MLRLILRLWLTLLLFFVGRLFGSGSRRGRFGAPGEGPGHVPSDGGSGDPRARPQRSGVPPLDRSDVTDVPFTEIPPPSDPAPGAAGRS